MIFKRKKKELGIFDDLPKAPENVPDAVAKKSKAGRRAMLIPDAPFTDDPRADLLLANTYKQREEWLEILFQSEVREAKQQAIASFLQTNYRVQKWWANSIALMFLKWRAQAKDSVGDEKLLRLLFEVPTTIGLTYNLLNSSSIYGEDFNRFLKLVQDKKLILSFKDETRATILLTTSDSGCEVIVEHEFIGNPVMFKERTKYWQQLFAKLIDQVSR